nr:hypothetical protein [Propionibacterium sp.]
MSRTTLRVVLTPCAALDVGRLLAEAAALARALDAELAALVVEEADLLSCVELPFTMEVGLVSGAVRPADPEATRRLLTRRAEQVRVLVAQTAAGLGLSWSFEVARGDLLREALSAAVAAPVVLAPPPSPAQQAVGRQPAPPAGGLVAVLAAPRAADASEPGESAEPGQPGDGAWATAVRLAGGRADLVVRLRPEDLARGPAPRALVVSLASLRDRPGELEGVLAAAQCPVVLVR